MGSGHPGILDGIKYLDDPQKEKINNPKAVIDSTARTRD